MGIFNQNGNYQRPNGSSPIRRWIIALGIALFAYFMYLNQVQVNPVTGEKQHVTYSPAQEIQLGLESAPVMTQKMGGELPATDPRSKEVQKIGNLIVSKTEASKSPWKFKFHLLEDTKTVNAFALPGGQIFITLGLFDKLETEAQLAGVLSHEMGHVIERHTAQQMAKSQLGELLVAAVATGAGSSQGSGNVYDPAIIAAVVNKMFQLRYSRHDESEADTWGLKLMSEVNYDPRAMIQVMEILKASGGGGHMPELFQTHPNPDLRIQQIKEYLEKNPSALNTNEGGKLKDIINSTFKFQ